MVATLCTPDRHDGTVIIGGGQAGLQVADSLRIGGYEDPITVIAGEPGQPYQRPPLSKDYLQPGTAASPLPLRGGDFFAENAIELLTGVEATCIDRDARSVFLADGGTMPYDHVVLATGARNRTLDCHGADLPGVHSLKTLHDAEVLQRSLGTARNVVVVGAGFIGLEFATAARAHGCRVTVMEYTSRPMGRALSAMMGDWFAAAHESQGVHLRPGERIASLVADADDRVSTVLTEGGENYPADLVVVGIGVIPNDGLATAAGLRTGNGIVVDEALRTSDPSILAVGDCANFPNSHAGGPTRIESVQNATDQGRHAAQTILGNIHPYCELPWFWSIQGPLRLQIAGISAPGDDVMVLGNPDDGKFSVLCHRDGRLAAVESVNSPADHMAARKLLTAGRGPGREEASEPGFTLKNHAKQALRAPALNR